jgi:hypothetical protein
MFTEAVQGKLIFSHVMPILQFIFIYSASNSGALLKFLDATY